MTYPLYGLQRASHDFHREESWGKNIFTNAFPIALAQYQALELNLPVVSINASISASGSVMTTQSPTPWEKIIGIDPGAAHFHFETPFYPYRAYTRGQPNPSDVVVVGPGLTHSRAFEIKLTTVPDSSSRKRSHDLQGPEIVARPLMIEQLAVSIVHSFGAHGVPVLKSAILSHIKAPQQTSWTNPKDMHRLTPKIIAVIEDIIEKGIENAWQTPMVLNTIWRTVGTTPELEDNCFENFIWSDLAFLTLFLRSAKHHGSEITRPQRSLIWLVKMLFDYTSQNVLDAVDTTDLAYGLQTDKAGSFSGSVSHEFLDGQYLRKPRIHSDAVGRIIAPGYRSYLAPERRLDAALYIETLRSETSG